MVLDRLGKPYYLRAQRDYPQPLENKSLMSNVKRALAILPLLAVSSMAGSIRGKVTGVYCGYYSGANMCSIYFDKDIAGLPTCVSGVGEVRRRFQIRMDNEVAKAVLSIALTAYSTKATVEASGKGVCDIWGDTESLNVLFIIPPGY